MNTLHCPLQGSNPDRSTRSRALHDENYSYDWFVDLLNLSLTRALKALRSDTTKRYTWWLVRIARVILGTILCLLTGNIFDLMDHSPRQNRESTPLTPCLLEYGHSKHSPGCLDNCLDTQDLSAFGLSLCRILKDKKKYQRLSKRRLCKEYSTTRQGLSRDEILPPARSPNFSPRAIKPGLSLRFNGTPVPGQLSTSK